MAANGKKRFGRRTTNEFDEILELKLKKNPKIDKDDVLDMIIDLELYNKAAVKPVVSKRAEKKSKGDGGKKRCIKKSRPKRKAYTGKKTPMKKESSNASENTRKSLACKNTDSTLDLYAAKG